MFLEIVLGVIVAHVLIRFVEYVWTTVGEHHVEPYDFH